ncbi:DExH-box ATP-dependent RNA helicase DExH16 [Chlorella vulgaris]
MQGGCFRWARTLLSCRNCRSYSALPAQALTDAVTDLGCPASLFPIARALSRRIVAHLGPTNSGKTHAALQHLRQAASGIYCGPLRLLAWQVHAQLCSSLPCNLVTGQERREELGARHTACTVEMASHRAVVDVAVVDEVQMLADHSRGWAWTRALLGVPARTLHVCGDPAVLPLLEKIAGETGEELEVRHYQRLSPLVPARRPLACLSQVRSGDCVVAFTRRDVHAVRQEVESHGRHRCCVVYGALPPNARQLQAALFNASRTGFNVLAASDAVGMGLNLSIRRIIFTSIRKWDGTADRQLTAAEIKQIAGRAGRYGSRFPSGTVTAMNAADLRVVADALQQPSEALTTAHLLPSLSQLELLHSQHPQDNLPALLRRFAAAAAGSLAQTHYCYAQYEDQYTLATMLRHLPLSLQEAWTFSISPTDPADAPLASALLRFATAYARQLRVPVAATLLPPLAQARSEVDLLQLETCHRILDLYLWLAHRFPDAFEGAEDVALKSGALAALIDTSIREMGVQRRCRASSEAAAAAADDASLEAEAEWEQQQVEEWMRRKRRYHKHRR